MAVIGFITFNFIRRTPNFLQPKESLTSQKKAEKKLHSTALDLITGICVYFVCTLAWK